MRFPALAGTLALLCVVVPSYAGARGYQHTLNDVHVGKTKSELVAQQEHSQDVIRFFTAGHPWLRAPHKASCQAVPWTASCKRARAQLRAHLWLYSLAVKRYHALYAPVAAIAHRALWLCIHAKEGDWKTGYNPDGPWYAGLQMTWGWGELVGDPRNYSAEQQMLAAEHEYAANHYKLSWLRQQWPTSYGCI